MADLQELFARLKSSSSASPAPSSSQQQSQPFQQSGAAYQPPSVSSPIFSPPSSTPNPAGSAILTPKAGTPAQDAKAANLLNLLRFNGQAAQQSSPLTAMQNVSAAPENGAAGGAPPSVLSTGSSNGQAARNVTSPVPNPQDFLLNLLKQPAKTPASPAPPLQAPQPQSGAQGDVAKNLANASAELDTTQASAQSKGASPVRQFGSAASRETTPFEAPVQAKSGGMFTYVNPFEQLNASTPTRRTPKPETTAAPTTPQPQPSAPVAAAQAAAPTPATPATVTQKDVAVKKEPDSVPETWQADTGSEDVKVYNFPMRPFVSIQLNDGHAPSSFRTDNMDIVRLKKEFDQIDRSLVTASQSHIVYAMSKSGGFRIIRQDSGRDKQVFKASQERIFNIQAKESTAGTPSDSILAAGINGTVFWTSVELALEDKFVDEDLEGRGFILPALNSVQDDNTSGSPVKTRSKMSSRHPDVFAISRGKSIHLVSPQIAASTKYMDSNTRIVDTNKFFQDRSHKITTGKACKDFAFSEDDTTIASLDKAGRIRFWDVKELSDMAKSPKKSSTELKTPVLTFTASMASDKISPTSIMFLDKERPLNKGIALRYLLVGFKQNHVLQLWDMGLGKPVQELHFPHEKDSDAICSITYHPKTGIIALAHPTRNSVYFIHLSAPRYHIPNMDQAQYTSMIANEDPALPRPESTAIMSGVRELSFGGKGQLRSVDMLTNPMTSNSDGSEAEEILFELYAMHSSGVTCLGVKKADMGWKSDNTVLNPIDAVKSGFITLSPISTTSETSSNSDTTPKPKPVASAKVETPKPQTAPAPKAEIVPEVVPAAGESVRESIETPAPPVVAETSKPAAALASAVPAQAKISLPAPNVPKERAPSPSTRSTSLADRTKAPAVNGVTSTASADLGSLANTLTSGFDVLYRKIEDDRRVQDAAASARQDAVLRLVSSTLTDNVEKSLSNIVSTGIQQEVLPAVSDVFTAMAERRLLEHLNETVGRIVPQEIRAALPTSLATAFKDPETSQLMAGPIANDLSRQVVASMEGVVRKTVAPMISQTIATSVHKAITDSEERFAAQRAEDAGKIDRLANLVFGLSETMQKMSENQLSLQQQVAAMAQQNVSAASPTGIERAASPVVEKSPEDMELDGITDLMKEGQFEDGTIRWLQSTRQAELFDRLFVRVNPQYLQKLSPLVKLSVSAAVSTSFEQNVDQRLDWLTTILETTDLQDPEIAQVAPKIMNVLLSRIQGAYMAFAESNPADPVLRNFSNLSRRITDIRKVLG